MANQHISYVPFEDVDSRMQEELERCAKHGTPRPESSAIRAHSPEAFWAFADSWQSLFHQGVVDHAIKDLCRVYISRSVKCEFCGNQRSEKAATAGLLELQYDELLNFETADVYDDRQKAALAYAQSIAWGVDDVDALWERLYRYFDERELVELGCCIALTFGQQSWIRLLGIEHHQYMAGTSASMAPGFRTADELAESKSSPEYWAAGSQYR
jgi:alkylhydroperoxidase family enzyme